jgi:hypothetical protein
MVHYYFIYFFSFENIILFSSSLLAIEVVECCPNGKLRLF